MYSFFSDEWLNFETVRILGTAPSGGADICEVLDAVAQIRESDPETWQHAWQAQAKRAEATAECCIVAGNRPLARNALLRAANYTRASGYMLVGETPALQPATALPIAERAVDLFRRATEYFDGEVRVLSIPYAGGLQLDGYLFLPSPEKRVYAGDGSEEKKRKIPVVINCGGADSTKEELYFLNPAAGTELGYACLTFDGPGQGMSLRKHGLKLRADWEYVMRYVLGFLEEYEPANPHLGLDLDRVAVSGSALGGYLALRAASDPRIKACVAIDPVYDLFDFATRRVPPLVLQSWTRGWVSDSVLDTLLRTAARWSLRMKWEVSLAGAFWGLDRPTEIMREMHKFTLRGAGDSKAGFPGLVKCPTLVSGAKSSLYLEIDEYTMRT
ncbi:alpha/beta-hydrolase [Aspergillus heterothallicus]